jgi:hypothetical protein
MVASKEDLIRIARHLGLRARVVKTNWDRLEKTPLPAIFLAKDEKFGILSRVIDGHAAVHSGGAARPANVVVNGSTTGTLPFESTGAWTTWSSKTVTVALNAGSNTIRFDPATAAGLPNIDYLDING